MEQAVSMADGLEQPLADFFKVLSCASRIHILRILLQGETSVGVLAEQLGMTGSSVSHQLQILRTARLVRQRKLGKERRYALASEAVRTMLEAGAQCVGSCTTDRLF